MEGSKARQEKPADHSPTQAAESGHPAQAASGFGLGDASMLLALQRCAGNAAVAALVAQRQDEGDRVTEYAPFRSMAHSPRHPDYSSTNGRRRDVDPERPRGPLPFTGRGWDGDEISRRLSQLNIAIPRVDADTCVETSFVANLVQQGPEAVRDAMLGYLSRYRAALDNRATPPLLRRRFYRASVTLEGALQALAGRYMTYADLAQLPRAMITLDVRSASQGTTEAEETNIALAQGYSRTDSGVTGSQTRAAVARLAAPLMPGEYLSCGIDSSDRGNGDTNHAVHIGRSTNGVLYFYDPWPRRGNQRINVSPDLAEIDEYFVGQWRGRAVARTFLVVARFTPPQASSPTASVSSGP